MAHAKQHLPAPIRISPASTAWPGHQLAEKLEHAIDAEHQLADSQQAKALHRWRVELRQLIAAVDGLAKQHETIDPALVQSLKSLRRRAGASRDIDVLLDTILPDFLSSDPGLRTSPALLGELQAQRAQARQQALAVIDGGLQALRPQLDRLRQAHASGELSPQALAATLLDLRLRKFRRRAHDFRDRPRRLHRFRTAVKNLGYTVALADELFPAEASAAWKKTLSKLQKQLGQAHDCHSASAYLATLQRPAAETPFIEAFQRWCAHETARSARKAARTAKRLLKLERYWRQ